MYVCIYIYIYIYIYINTHMHVAHIRMCQKHAQALHPGGVPEARPAAGPGAGRPGQASASREVCIRLLRSLDVSSDA